MKKVFWFFVLGLTIASLFGVMWAVMLGWIQLPWYGSAGIIVTHLVVALYGMVETGDKKEPKGEVANDA